jgi:hypothetical protein
MGYTRLSQIRLALMALITGLAIGGCTIFTPWAEGPHAVVNDVFELLQGRLSPNVCKLATDQCSVEHLQKRMEEVLNSGGRRNFEISKSSTYPIVFAVKSFSRSTPWHSCEFEHYLVIVLTDKSQISKGEAARFLYFAANDKLNNLSGQAAPDTIDTSRATVALIASMRKSCSLGGWAWHRDRKIRERYSHEVRRLMQDFGDVKK